MFVSVSIHVCNNPGQCLKPVQACEGVISMAAPASGVADGLK